MPTKKQMDNLRDSEIFLKNQSEKVKAKNLKPKDFTGKEIGTISANPKTKDLEINIEP